MEVPRRLKIALAVLEPICKRITETKTVDSIRQLEELINKLQKEDICDPVLTHYITFPLYDLLQVTSSTEKRRIALVDCIKAIAYKAELCDWITFENTFLISFIYLSKKDDISGGFQVSDISEEEKIAYMECCTSLLRYLDLNGRKKICKRSWTAKLGHAIFIATKIAKGETNRKLRLCTLDFLKHLIHCDSGLTETEKGNDVERRIGVTLVNFLPGISQAMMAVIFGDRKQGHKIPCTAFNVWSDLLTSVFCQEVMESENIVDDSESFKQTVINQEWITATTNNLKVLFEGCATISCHSDVRIRLAFHDWASCVLTKSFRWLGECVKVLMDVIITLNGDFDSRVQDAAAATLETLKTLNVVAQDVAQDGLYNVVESVPKVVSSDEQAHWALCHMNGQLRLLGEEGVSQSLLSSPCLQSLTSALLHIAKMDGHLTCDVAAPYSFSWLDSVSLRNLHQCCIAISSSAQSSLLVDYLIEVVTDDAKYRKEALFILNSIIKGWAGRGSFQALEKRKKRTSEVEDAVGYALEMYLSENLWKASFSKEGPCEVIEEYLLVEGLGFMVEVLQGSSLQYLKIGLCPLLEKSASSQKSVSEAAKGSLQSFALALGFDDEAALVRHHIGFVSHHVSVKLRHCHPEIAPFILTTALNYCDAAALPHVTHCVREVLWSLDSNPTQISVAYIRVLTTFARCMSKWFAGERRSDVPKLTDGKCDSSGTTTKHLLKLVEVREKQRTKEKESENELEFNKSGEEGFKEYFEEKQKVEEEEEDAPIEEESEAKKSTPEHYQLLMDCMDRCANLLQMQTSSTALILSDEDTHGPWMTVELLKLATICCECLKVEDDWLLPSVHRVWAALMFITRSPHFAVLSQAFTCLLELGKCAKDFIRKRTLTQVWPRFHTFLRNQGKISSSEGGNTFYVHSQAYQLQRRLLCGLGTLVENLGVHEREVDNLALVASAYLSINQPVELQLAAIGLFESLKRSHPGVVWLRLHDLWTPSTFLISSYAEFPCIEVTGSSDKNNEFAANVQQLLGT